MILIIFMYFFISLFIRLIISHSLKKLVSLSIDINFVNIFYYYSKTTLNIF